MLSVPVTLMNQENQPAFRALADPTRRAILQHLCGEELTISEVVEKFHLTRTAVRKHLTILEEGNLITMTPRGNERVSKLNPDGLKTTVEWFSYFDQFWDNALGSLKSVVERKNQARTNRKKTK